MNRYAILGMIGLCLVSLIAAGYAKSPAVKIGTIETQRIIKESNAAKKARAVLQEDLKKKSAIYQEKEDEALILQRELQRERGGGDPNKIKEKTDALALKTKELRRLKADLEEELNKKNRELTQKILKEVKEIITAYSKQKKYTVILEKSSVVTADVAIDITSTIIDLYDTKKK